ncbi:FxsA family protein [Ostreiculturibacter nitratireducens]|uniref:FxsA family protein n=1 Tax=Ostreiculturibacter nitratireducens TaxID=3075226 RepID=UPI0031B57C01
MWLLLAFLAVPLIEIALFIQVGSLIGVWPTLAIVLLTAVVGTMLMRTQGAATLLDLRRSFEELRDPGEPLAHGAMILFAGALLLTPGFFTDTLGLLLLTPPFRRWLLKALASRVTVERFEMGRRPPREPDYRPGDVIDGEFQEVDPEKRPTHSPSGWTRH